MRVTFDEVAVKATRYYKDPSGKRRQETKRFFQTVNPFNRNADGSVKTREQIQKEVQEECSAWLRSEQ